MLSKKQKRKRRADRRKHDICYRTRVVTRTKRLDPLFDVGRPFAPEYTHVVAAARPPALDRMVVFTRHRGGHYYAQEMAEFAARILPGWTIAVLALYGHTRRDYLPGDVLDPDDVYWTSRVADGRCSMCCHPFGGPGPPKGLDYTCADQTPCTQIQSLIVRGGGCASA